MSITRIFCRLWQYGLWSFQPGGTKLKRFLPKNQHIQGKPLKFDFWINGKLSKSGNHFSDKFFLILILSKNVNKKMCF